MVQTVIDVKVEDLLVGQAFWHGPVAKGQVDNSSWKLFLFRELWVGVVNGIRLDFEF